MEGSVFTWGSNSRGQLGVGDDRIVPSVVKIQNLGKNHRYVAAKGNLSYILDSNGQVQRWPNFDAENEQHIFTPRIMEIKNKNVSFKSISCGENFLVALSNNGSVFTQGYNSVGQLGHGDKKDRGSLCIVKYFLDHNDKIAQVSAGGSHVVAKSTHGGIFSWGYNKWGQLGNGSNHDQYLPKFLRISHYPSNLFKVQSVQAGYNSTHVLCEDNNVFIAGYNTMTANDENMFLLLDWKAKLMKSTIDPPFGPVKIMTKWSKCLQVTYLILADFRGLDFSQKEKQNFCTRLSNNWEDSYDQIVPFIDSDLLMEYNDRTTPQKKDTDHISSPVREDQKTAKKPVSKAKNAASDKKSPIKFKTDSNFKEKLDSFVATGSVKKRGLKVDTNKSSNKKTK